MNKGTYEYKILKCPYDINSCYACNWFQQQYNEGGWELVCPVNNYISSGNSRDDYLYIFRKWIPYSYPEKTI